MASLQMVKDGNPPITMPSKVTIKKQIPHETMKAETSNFPVPSRMTIVPRRRKRAPHDLPSCVGIEPGQAADEPDEGSLGDVNKG